MKPALLSVLLVSVAMLVPACGGDDTSGTGTAAGGGSGPAAQANGCTTFTSATTINFSGTTYTPNCVKVAKGGTVTFKGDFATHPLHGGAATESKGTGDPASPIPQTNTGMEKAVTFPAAGTFGFFCDVHVSVGMRGAIQVE